MKLKVLVSSCALAEALKQFDWDTEIISRIMIDYTTMRFISEKKQVDVGVVALMDVVVSNWQESLATSARWDKVFTLVSVINTQPITLEITPERVDIKFSF